MPEETYKPVGPSVVVGSGNGLLLGGKAQSKYDIGSKYSEINDLNAVRARKQPAMTKIGNMLLNTIGVVVGQTLEGVGAIGDGLVNLLGGNIEPGEGMASAGASIREGMTNEIYYDGNWSPGYILANLPNVASSLTLLVPGLGISKAAGWAARAKGWGTLAEKSVSMIAGGIAMRHAENRMEANQVYKDVMADFAMGTNRTGSNPTGEIFGEDESKEAAATGFKTTMMKNWANAFFDMAQLGMILKPFGNRFFTALGDNALTSTLDYGFKATKARGLYGGVKGAIPSRAAGAEIATVTEGAAGTAGGVLIPDIGKFKKSMLYGVDVLKPIMYQSTEGVEEMINYIAQQEGYRAAGIKAGTIKEDGSSYLDRIRGTYLKDSDLWNSGAWGIAGGVTFQLLGGSASSYMDKLAIRKQIAKLESAPGDRAQNEEKIKALKEDLKKHKWWNNVLGVSDTITSLKQRQEQIAEYAAVMADSKKSDEEKFIAKAKLKAQLLTSGSTTAHLDLLMADLENATTRSVLAQQFGSTVQEAEPMFKELLEQAKWMKDTINGYQGETFKSWRNNKSEAVDTELDIVGSVTEPSPRRTEDTVLGEVGFGSFANPRLAVQMAFNDFMSKEYGALNNTVLEKIRKIETELFSGSLGVVDESGRPLTLGGGKEVSINGRKWISLTSDIEALESVQRSLEMKKESFKAINATKRTMDAHTKMMDEAAALIKAKKDALAKVEKEINDNRKDPAIKDSETSLDSLKALTSGISSNQRAIRSNKIIFFQNQTERVKLQELNRQIFEDPLAYEKESIEDFRRLNDYLAAKEESRKARAEALESIATSIEALTKPENKEYADKYKYYLDKFTAEVEALPDMKAKQDHVARLFKKYSDKHIGDTKDGKFKQDSLKEFSDFDTTTYIDNKAALAAISKLQETYKPVLQRAPLPSSGEGARTPEAQKEHEEVKKLKDWLDNFSLLFTEEALAIDQIIQLNDIDNALTEVKKDLAIINSNLELALDKDTDRSVRDVAEKVLKELVAKYDIIFGATYDSEMVNAGKGDRVVMLGAAKHVRAHLAIAERKGDAIVKALDTALENNEFFSDDVWSGYSFPISTEEREKAAASGTVIVNKPRLSDPFVKYFEENVRPNYKSLREMLGDYKSIIAQISAHIEATEKQYTENRKLKQLEESGPDRALKPEELIAVAIGMETPLRSKDEKDAFTVKGFSDTRKVITRASGILPATNEHINQEGTPYRIGSNGRAEVDSLGRRIPNAEYLFKDFHYIDKDGNRDEAFVKQGDDLELRLEKVKYKDTDGNIVTTEDVRVYNKGKHVTTLNSVENLTKIMNTYLKSMKDEGRTEAHIKAKEAEFLKNLELIKEIKDGVAKLGGRALINIANPFEATKEEQSISPRTSGGVFIGSMYNLGDDERFEFVEVKENGKTVRKKKFLSRSPLSFRDAFGDKVNTKNEAQIAIYWKGNFYGVNENGQKVPILKMNPDMHIPESEMRVFHDGNLRKSEYNGFPVVLVPTNTLTGTNKHIYMPIRLGFTTVAKAEARSNGTTSGDTLPSRIFDIIMNPDKRQDEFIELLKLIGIDSKIKGSLSDKENYKLARAFYTTNNLLQIFNKVIYAYDNSDEHIKKDKNRDYSNHVGLDVFESPKNKKTYLRFNLTSTTKDPTNGQRTQHKNSFAFEIFDENGNFAIRSKRTLRKDLGFQESTTDTSLYSELSQLIDPEEDIRTRLDKANFRIDFDITKPVSAQGVYKGISFNRLNGGKISVIEYPNYYDYVSKNKLATSRVYGVVHTIHKDGKSFGWRSYYHSRMLFLNPKSLRPYEVAAEKKETKKKKGPDATKKPVSPDEKKALVVTAPGTQTPDGIRGVTIKTDIPDHVRKSMNLRNAGRVERSADGKIWKINGVNHESLSSVFPNPFPKSSGKTLATATGDMVDELSKDYFSNNLHADGAAYYNMSPALYSHYLGLMSNVLKDGEQVIGTGILLWATLPNGRKVAGEVDLMTIDLAGNIIVYDFKTTRGRISEKAKAQYALKMSGYAVLNSLMGGDKVAGLKLLETVVRSESNPFVRGGVRISSLRYAGEINLKFDDNVYDYLPITETAPSETEATKKTAEEVAALQKEKEEIEAMLREAEEAEKEAERKKKEMDAADAEAARAAEDARKAEEERQEQQRKADAAAEATRKAKEAKETEERQKALAEQEAKEKAEAERLRQEEEDRKREQAEAEAEAARLRQEELDAKAEQLRKAEEEAKAQQEPQSPQDKADAERKVGEDQQAATLLEAQGTLTEEEGKAVQTVYEQNKQGDETKEEFLARAIVAEQNKQPLALKGKKSVLDKFREALRKIIRYILTLGVIATIYVNTSLVSVPSNTEGRIGQPDAVTLNTQGSIPIEQVALEYHQSKHPGTAATIVDKATRKITIYDSTGTVIYTGQALVGESTGRDASTPGVTYKYYGDYKADDKVTPAGAFILQRMPNAIYGQGSKYVFYFKKPDNTQLFVGGFSPAFHTSVNEESRLRALQSETTADNAITYGCISILPEVFNKIQDRLGPVSHIYVIPDSDNRVLYTAYLKEKKSNPELSFSDFVSKNTASAPLSKGGAAGSGAAGASLLMSLLAFIRKREEEGNPLSPAEKAALLRKRLEDINKDLLANEAEGLSEPLGKTDPAVVVNNDDKRYNIDDEEDESDLIDDGSSMSSVTHTEDKTMLEVLRDPSSHTQANKPDSFVQQATDLVSDIIFDILYRNRMLKGNRAVMNRLELRDAVLTELNAIVEDYSNMLANNIASELGNVRKISDTGNKKIVRFINRIKTVIQYLDFQKMNEADRKESGNFVGYFYTAFNQLNRGNMLQTSLDDDAGSVEVESNPGNRYISNATVRLNPKHTMTQEAKIIFSQIREYKSQIDSKGRVRFKEKYNYFGLPKYYSMDFVRQTMEMLLEGVNPSKMFGKLESLKDSNPVVYSIYKTAEWISSEHAKNDRRFKGIRPDDVTTSSFKALEKKKAAIGNLILQNIGSFIKQGRKLNVVNATLPDDFTKPTITIFPADRQGIRANVIGKWEDNFKSRIKDLFVIERIENTVDSTKPNYTSRPKEQEVYTSARKGIKYVDFRFSMNTEGVSTASVMNELFSQLSKSVALGGKVGGVRVHLDLRNGRLYVDGKETEVTDRDALTIVSLFHLGDRVIFEDKLTGIVNDFKGDEDSAVFKKTYLAQIKHNIDYFLSRSGVVEASDEDEADTRGDRYEPIVYRFINSQLERFGIQLSENPEENWKVLAKLNAPMDNNQEKRKYNHYDWYVDTFSQFLEDKLYTLFIDKLSSPVAFTSEAVYEDEFGNIEGGKPSFNILNPFAAVADALEPFAIHASGNWVSYANESVRNVKNQREWTFVPHNTLSLLINEIHDPNSPSTGFLADLSQTAFGKHNWYLSRIVEGDPNILKTIQFRYTNGSVVNNQLRLGPDESALGILSMMEWGSYFAGENSRDGAFRKPGEFAMTLSDSTQMPMISFMKDIIPMKFIRTYDADGNMDFRILISPTNADGTPSLAYEKLYSLFHAEVHRVYEGTIIWNEINEWNKKYSFKDVMRMIEEKKYIHGVHYNMKDGKIVGPGSSTKLFFWGKEYFDNPGLIEGLFNEDGSLDIGKYSGGSDTFLRNISFPSFINDFMNRMIDDAYQGHLAMKGDFYIPSKSGRITFTYPYLNEKSVTRITKQLFDNNVLVDDDEGGWSVPRRVLDDRVTGVPLEGWLESEENLPAILVALGMEVQDAESFSDNELSDIRKRYVELATKKHEEEVKTARLAYAEMKYMIADRIINTFIMQVTMRQMMFDPANMEYSSNYDSVMEKYAKRQMSFLAPRMGLANNGPVDSLYSITYRDVLLGARKKVYSDAELSKMTPGDRAFIEEFKKRFADNPKIVGENGAIPFAAVGAAFIVQGARNPTEIEKRWKLIEQMMVKTEITNGSGFFTAREFFFRLTKMGIIDSEQYLYFVKKATTTGLDENDAKKLGARFLRVHKYVYAGPNVIRTGSFDTLMMNYIKNGEWPLIKGLTVHEGTDMYKIMNALEIAEARNLEGFSTEDVLPGLVLNPPSSMKVGVITLVNLFNEDSSFTDELENARPVALERDFHGEQQAGSEKHDESVTMSSQQVRLIYSDMPATTRYGKLQFDNSAVVYENLSNEDKEDLEYLQSLYDDAKRRPNGITRAEMDLINYRMFSHIANRRFRHIMASLGIRYDSGSKFSIDDIQAFVKAFVEFSENRYSISGTTLAYLMPTEDGKNIRFSITLNPSNLALQSVLLSQLEKMFSRFKLPGHLLATIPHIEVEEDEQLRGPRITSAFKTFKSKEAVYELFSPEELMGDPVELGDGSWRAEYRVIEPGEVKAPFAFKRDGKPVNYKDYVDENGRVKKHANGLPMIDPDVLETIMNRIPNTGANGSSAGKIVRFFPEGVTDAIAVSPYDTEVKNADHDHDVLYVYAPNYEFDADGRIVKVQGILAANHVSQAGKQISSDTEISKYVQRRILEEDADYNTALLELETLQEELTELQNSEQATALQQEFLKLKEAEVNERVKKMKKKEVSLWRKYRAEYFAAGIYGRQTDEQLFNAIIDLQRIVLLDSKMLGATSKPLTSDEFHDPMNKILPTLGMSIMEAANQVKFKHFASFWTNTVMRDKNNNYERQIGTSANALMVHALMQQIGGFYNSDWVTFAGLNNYTDVKSHKRELKKRDLENLETSDREMSMPEFGFGFLFSDNSGKVKHEEGLNDILDEDTIDPDSFDPDLPITGKSRLPADNVTHRFKFAKEDKDGMLVGQRGAYKTFVLNKKSVSDVVTADGKLTGRIAHYPSVGRFRLDRIWVINNKGEKVYVSDHIKAMLQAMLDRMNKQIHDFQNINMDTFNAQMALIFLGYVDEAPLVLMQDVVKSYVHYRAGRQEVGVDIGSGKVTAALNAIADVTGLDVENITRGYYKLDLKQQHIVHYLNLLISARMGNEFTPESLSVSENDLLRGLEMGRELNSFFGNRNQSSNSNDKAQYELIQLKALRNFMLADQFGSQISSIQLNTNYVSKGAGNSILEVTAKYQGVKDMMDIVPVAGGKRYKLNTNVSMVGGVHRLLPEWQSQVWQPFSTKELQDLKGGSKSVKSRGWVPTFAALGYKHGLVNIMGILKAAENAGMFYEGGAMFKYIQDTVLKIGNIDRKSMSKADYQALLKRININFISFMMSDPNMFENMFSEEEFEFFKNYGRRAQSMPDSSLADMISEDFEVFNEIKSAALLLKELSEDTDENGIPYKSKHVLVNALRPWLQITEDYPSSIGMSVNSRYIIDLGNKLAASLSTMYKSKDKKVSTLAKRIILKAYQNGGVLSHHSFVQYIHPSILIDLGVDLITKRLLERLSDKPHKNAFTEMVAKTFAIQYYQHRPYDLAMKVYDKSLELIPGIKVDKEGNKEKTSELIAYDPVKLKGMYIRMKHDAKVLKAFQPILVSYKDRLWLRVDYKETGDNGYVRFREIDRAGYRRFGNNEFTFPDHRSTLISPTTSQYAMNRAEKSAPIYDGVPELSDDISGGGKLSDFSQEEVEAFVEAGLFYKRPLSSNLLELEGSEDEVYLHNITSAAIVSGIESDAASFLGVMQEIVNKFETTVEFINDDTSFRMKTFVTTDPKTKLVKTKVQINLRHPDYLDARAGATDAFNQDLFINDLAHEVQHIGTLAAYQFVTGGISDDKKLKKRIDTMLAKDVSSAPVVHAVLNLKTLHDLLKKSVLSRTSPAYKDFKRFAAITEKQNKGIKLSEEETAFWNDNNYLRAFKDLNSNNDAVTDNEFKEFLAYLSDPKMQKLLNNTPLSDDEKSLTFWESILKVIADILQFFGLGNLSEEEVEQDVTAIKQYFKDNAKFSYEFIKKGVPDLQTMVVTGDAPTEIQNLQAYSALHIALRNVMDLYEYTRKVSRVQGSNMTREEAGISDSSEMTSLTAASEDGVLITDLISEGQTSADVLKRIAKLSELPFNSEMATRLLLSSKSLPKLVIATRADIEAAYPEAASRKNMSIIYDGDKNTIYINKELSLSNEDFEDLILSELTHASAFTLMNRDTNVMDKWQLAFDQAAEIMQTEGISSKYINDPIAFLSGILRSQAFRNTLSKIFDGRNPDSLLDRSIRNVMSVFGIRKSRIENFTDLLDNANSVVKRGSLLTAEGSAMSAILSDRDFKVETGEDEPVEQTESSQITPVAVVEDYWQRQLTGRPLIDKYIIAHIEKIRAIKSRMGKKKDPRENERLLREKQKFGSFLKRISEPGDDSVLINVGHTEVDMIERNIDKMKSLDEIGENIKLLTAWREIPDALRQAIADKEIGGEIVDESNLAMIDALSGKATRVRAQYMGKLVDAFKDRAKEEHIPPGLVGGIHLDMAIEDIGLMMANFIGLSIGSNPIEAVVDFAIRLAAFNMNKEWIDSNDKFEDMLKKVGGNMDFMFRELPDGRRQIQMKYSPELHEKLIELASEVQHFEEERAPMMQKIKELQWQESSLRRQKLWDDANEISDKIAKIKEELDRHKDATKSWDTYMDFMRENFEMDLMKVDIPLTLEDGSDNTHPDAGKRVTLKYANMTEQERKWALEPWEREKKDLQEAFMKYSEDGTEARLDEAAYNDAINALDPESFLDWYYKKSLSRPSKGGKWFAFKPNDNWKNSAFYDKLTSEQKEFYDWFTESFVDAHEAIPQNTPFFGEYEEDMILRQFVFMSEEAASKFKYLTKDLTNWMSNLVMTDVPTAKTTNKLDAPLSERKQERLRFKSFRATITKDQGYYKKGDELPKDIQDKLDLGQFKWNDINVLVSLKGNPVKRIVPAMFDPVQMYKDFKAMSIGYKYKKDIEDILQSAMEMVEHAKVVTQKKYGRPTKSDTPNYMSERLAATINAFMYDKRANAITDDDIRPGEKAVSGAQIFDTLNKFTRARQLGLNLVSGITNLGMGTINNYMAAGRDEFFNESDLNWAYWKLKSSIVKFFTGGKVVTDDAKKIMLILRKFNLIGGFLEESFVSNEDLSKLFNKLFIFQQSGEFLNQGAVILSMMRREKIKDPITKKEILGADGNPISLWDAFELKDGRLSFKYPESDYNADLKVATFGMAASQVIKEIHGDYDPLNFKKINKTVLGRILMTFRNWMPMAIETRVGKRREDSILSEFLGHRVIREGRWVTMKRALRGTKANEEKGIKEVKVSWRETGIRSLRFVLGVVASTVRRSWGQKIMGNLGLTEKFEQQNLAVMMKEVWWLSAISTFTAVVKGLRIRADDDDDGETTAFLTWLYNQSARIDNDLWFYYNPVDAQKVIRDPVAIWSTLLQATKVSQAAWNWASDPSSDIYKRGFRKGNSKFWTQTRLFLPIVRQGETMWSMVENMYTKQIIR